MTAIAANPPASNQIGVYFLANDGIYDWAVAFLESLRRFNPELRVVLIPFDDRCERVLRLANRYQFDVYRDPAFEELEAFGRRINRGKVSYAPHWFRRFAAFWGPLEEFLYLDGRIVVLSDLRRLIDARQSSGYDLLHYDCAIDQVYCAGPFHDAMIRKRGPTDFSLECGLLGGLFTLDELGQFIADACDLGEQLNYRNADQCFLNYACDAKGISYAGFCEVIDNLVSSCWARYPGVYRAGNRYFRWDHGGLEHNRQIPFLHWAGSGVGPAMYYSSLFLHFRMLHEPAWNRMLRQGQWMLARPPLRALDALRRDRRLNTLYHMLRHRLLSRDLPERLRAAQEERGGE